jgi:ABC-type multidrug transport system ATPase subunit
MHDFPQLRQLVVNALCFAYPGRALLDNWSHAFDPGITWIQGANGRGKSTLLKLIAGALVPRSGSLKIGQVDAILQPIDYRRCVFWCGSGDLPFGHLTPREYFGFVAGLYPGFEPASLFQHVEGFSLAPFLDNRIQTLSAGTQRKTWLSAALAAKTPVLLLDEPVSALDAEAVNYLAGILNELNDNLSVTCIVVSHEPFGPAGNSCRKVDIDCVAILPS